MTNLPANLSEALRSSEGELQLVDPVTQKVYFLVEDEVHRRALEAMRQQEDWVSLQTGLAEAERGEGMTLEEADSKIREQLGFRSAS